MGNNKSMNKYKIRKGCIVRLNKDVCFTEKSGGKRQFPLTNYNNDNRLVVKASRPITKEETSTWYASDASKGMNSVGESKLPPQSVSIDLMADRVYTVLRARCRVRLGWGNPRGGMVKILCSKTGQEAYVKRDYVEAIS